MKSYNKCQGCGLIMQNTNPEEVGYVPNIDSPICKKCFRSKNYGEFDNNLNTFYELEEIQEIKDDNVIMIIDILNPFETMISNINDYVEPENLILLVNKVDSLPKSIPTEAFVDWIDEIAEYKDIEFSQLAMISTTKKINVDAVAAFILSSDRDTSIIGYSNVGKSSLIKALFNAVGLEVNNLITNSIGTTKEVIELEYEDKIIKDYPGIILEGSYQNIMTIDQLKQTHPKKEIKVTNYQLSDFQTIKIGDFAEFHILESEDRNGYQFSFSNHIEFHRGKYKQHNNEFITHEIEHKSGVRYDLVISGLGIITFKSNNQKIKLSIPKGVKFNLINSLYQ